MPRGAAPFGADHGHGHIFTSTQASFDLLGAALTEPPRKPHHRSPEMRCTSPRSFLQEITPEQMMTYTPDQISTILEQREHVSSIDPHAGGPRSDS